MRDCAARCNGASLAVQGPAFAGGEGDWVAVGYIGQQRQQFCQNGTGVSQ